MIPRNGFCLLVVILCITVNNVVSSEKSKPSKPSKIRIFQNKLELLSDKLTASTKKPSTSRPTYRPRRPIYWPPYPPPPYYPPSHYPPQHYPPQHHPPSTRPTKRPGHHPPKDAIKELCKIPANRNLIVCQRVCKHFPDISICLPICSLNQYQSEPYCDPACIASESVPCSLPASADVDPPNGCPEETELVTECALYCLTYPDDDDLDWCATQLEQLEEGDDDDRRPGAHYRYGFL